MREMVEELRFSLHSQRLFVYFLLVLHPKAKGVYVFEEELRSAVRVEKVRMSDSRAV